MLRGMRRMQDTLRKAFCPRVYSESGAHQSVAWGNRSDCMRYRPIPLQLEPIASSMKRAVA
jgi:hypothetical protein